MNQTNIAPSPMPVVLRPTEILKQLAETQSSGYLEVLDDSVRYKIYIEAGRLVYATHSVDPLERLERHLRFLSHKVKTLTREVRTEVRLEFEEEINRTGDIPVDYSAIFWLVDKKYLTLEDATRLTTRLNLEVLESFLSLHNISDKIFVKAPSQLDKLRTFDTLQLLSKCCQRLETWQQVSPRIWSSYQRPYFFSNQFAKEHLPKVKQEKLSHLLRGFNFRQLSALLNQDELKLAQRLAPLIAKGAILVREPQPPFDRLPKVANPTQSVAETTETTAEIQLDTTIERIDRAKFTQQRHKIACIDDSPTVLREMNRFLGEEQFEITTIDDSVKALTLLIRLEPDLILMDVGMPKLDGYQLCAMLRKHSRFRHTPIIMVTGNKGLIDRVKARMAGATDYMTKPFDQAGLLKMVFRYLS